MKRKVDFSHSWIVQVTNNIVKWPIMRGVPDKLVASRRNSRHDGGHGWEKPQRIPHRSQKNTSVTNGHTTTGCESQAMVVESASQQHIIYIVMDAAWSNTGELFKIHQRHQYLQLTSHTCWSCNRSRVDDKTATGISITHTTYTVILDHVPLVSTTSTCNCIWWQGAGVDPEILQGGFRLQ